MRKRFESASNYAAFIHDAMLRPDEGGRFYALVAFNRCMEVLAVELDAQVKVVGSTAIHEQGVKIIDDLKARCSTVKDYFPNEVAFIRELKRANAKGTPDALLIPRGALTPANGAFAQKDIEQAIRSGDPYLIAATVDINIDVIADRLGADFANGQNRSLLYMASAAAACEIVGDCRDSYRVMMPCVAGGTCKHADLRDHLRDNTEPTSRELFDKARSQLLALAGRAPQTIPTTRPLPDRP